MWTKQPPSPGSDAYALALAKMQALKSKTAELFSCFGGAPFRTSGSATVYYINTFVSNQGTASYER
jgi:hypothetical protein